MPEENVLRLLELLQANADQRKIRDLLLQASSTKITSLGAARFITATKELRGPPMLVTPVPA